MKRLVAIHLYIVAAAFIFAAVLSEHLSEGIPLGGVGLMFALVGKIIDPDLL